MSQSNQHSEMTVWLFSDPVSELKRARDIDRETVEAMYETYWARRRKGVEAVRAEEQTSTEISRYRWVKKWSSDWSEQQGGLVI